MGSMLTRYLRDLSDVGGFEAVNGSLPNVTVSVAEAEFQSTVESQPCTPVASKPVRVLDFDPRSPTAEIVRTPIEVISNLSRKFAQDSPMSTELKSRRSYLETDLDTLSTSEFDSKPESISSELKQKRDDPSLPPGLTCAHLMKLRFLGLDPRSPSSDVVRTPIQLSKDPQRDAHAPFHLDDTLSVGSLSSQDIFSNSNCSSDFTRDCSDPSAFISENEDSSDREDELNASTLIMKADKNTTNVSKEESTKGCCNTTNEQSPLVAEATPKASSKLKVFQEKNSKTSEAGSKQSPATPDGAKKPGGNRSRTPLTPLCNRNRTPNSILRAKQSHTIEKEILTKVNMYYPQENTMTPSKKSSLACSMKENVAGRVNHQGSLSSDENACLSGSKKRALAEWDQDSSVII